MDTLNTANSLRAGPSSAFAEAYLPATPSAVPATDSQSLPQIALSDPLSDASGLRVSVMLTISGPRTEPEVIYAKPVLPLTATSTVLAPEATIATRAWASAPADPISDLMARNLDPSTRSLADRWKGLGSALLGRFKTTQGDYTQTVADVAAVQSSEKLTNTQALASVADGQTQVSLKLQTRSGQTVELVISLGSLSKAVTKGLHVAVHVSGTLSPAERSALVSLSAGFDQVLDGLGQADGPRLNLAGLLNYDPAVFTRVDMRVKNLARTDALGSFEFHADASRKALSVQGRAGALAVNLDLGTQTAFATQAQQQAALRSYLAQFDAAAQRSHSDAVLVEQFKQAFVQLHEAATKEVGLAGAPIAPIAPTAPTAMMPLQMQIQPLLSGLKDFEASFGGGFSHANARGDTTETGDSDFQLSQKTSTTGRDPTGAVTVSQTQSAQLAAHYLQATNGGRLDTDTGNYDSYRIRDRSETTTTIDTAHARLVSALSTSLQDQWLGFERRVNHHVTETRESPFRKVSSRSLL
ncbi:MAG: hypothetical protein JWP29_467 [Rhodoferax sp.]|nr:hypothetical protein [Rhodoferax sp.]